MNVLMNAVNEAYFALFSMGAHVTRTTPFPMWGELFCTLRYFVQPWTVYFRFSGGETILQNLGVQKDYLTRKVIAVSLAFI